MRTKAPRGGLSLARPYGYCLFYFYRKPTAHTIALNRLMVVVVVIVAHAFALNVMTKIMVIV
jgi:hypothetical protein